MEFINLLIFGKGKLSFKQALLRSMKSTHILHFPVLFFTITILTSQFGYMTSRMKLAVHDLSTSVVIACCLSPPKFLFFYRICRWFKLTWSLWVVMSELISNMSDVWKVKFSLQIERRSASNFYWSGSRVKPTLVSALFYPKDTSFKFFYGFYHKNFPLLQGPLLVCNQSFLVFQAW